MPRRGPPQVAVIAGASGGLGRALVAALAASGRHDRILALSREVAERPCGAGVSGATMRLEDEASIAAAAAQAAALGEVRLVIAATGVLHGEGLAPEKHWSAIEPAAMARAFAINATGPALLGKHFLPRLPRTGRSVFAALSARVGSIGDNRLGGWYAYRASKAALNMILRNFAIELARRAPDALCIGLHPGTVATALSAPFSARVPPEKLFSPEAAAAKLLRVIDGARPADSGAVLAWDGTRVPA